jgi:hypothetical protein
MRRAIDHVIVREDVAIRPEDESGPAAFTHLRALRKHAPLPGRSGEWVDYSSRRTPLFNIYEDDSGHRVCRRAAECMTEL